MHDHSYLIFICLGLAALAAAAFDAAAETFFARHVEEQIPERQKRRESDTDYSAKDSDHLRRGRR